MAGNNVTLNSHFGQNSSSVAMGTDSDVDPRERPPSDHSRQSDGWTTSGSETCLEGQGHHDADASCHWSLGPSRPRLRLFAFLAFGTLLVVAMATGMSRVRAKPTVHVTFPASMDTRKVRMFTDYPDLTKLSKDHSSLSLVSRLQLLDAKQCSDDPSNCKVSVVCDSTTVQSVNCRCRTGYFFKDWKCKACSSRCPADHYLDSPCSDHDDAVCKPCTVCGPTQYAAATCNTHRDTICIDVSFPVGILPLNQSNLPDDGIEISVSHSSNVFLERLVDMQRLDTPMYVTNNQQILDFVWERKSGLNIAVSVTGVYLIPTYRDLDAVDDTQVFLHHMTPSHDAKIQYKDVQKLYCRHPVPDYYSLQLQELKDRISAASVVRCDSQDSSIPACPSHFKDGDRWVKWDINERCPKYPKNETKLEDGYNSVVCTEETELLLKIFQRARPNTEEWMYPHQDCKSSMRECQDCIDKSSCPNANKSALFGDDSRCCGIPCFSSKACQQAYSSKCPTPKVECARGVVNVFLLFPVFDSLAHEFSCHLKYSPPRYLYNVSYSIQIPSIDYNSTEQYFYVSANSRKQHQSKMSQFDFITIHHDTRIPIEDEIMLIGNHMELAPYRKSLMKPFTIRRLKTPTQLATSSQFQLGQTGLSAFVQFERPFLYSSNSWYIGGCRKNISQMYPNQTMYGPNYIGVEAKRGLQRPDIHTNRDQENLHGFTYQMYRRNTQPFVKFITERGTSVLRHLQGRDVKGNLIPNSLYGRVTWHYETDTWKLVFSGTQDECPTIISIKIFTQLMTGCAGHFDLLINCPKDFTVTFNFSTSMSDLPDIFVLQINDSLTSHHMVLSSMYAPVHVDENKSKNQARTERQLSSADDHHKNFIALWQPIFFILGVSVATFFVIIVIYHYVNTKARIPETVPDATQQPETVALNNHGEKQNKTATSSPPPPKLKLSLYLFACLYLVYSAVFTFSLTFLIVYMAHSAFWAQTTHSNISGSELQTNVNKSIQQIKDFETIERSRLFLTFRKRREACVRHLEAENKKLLRDYQQTTQKQMDAIFMENGTLHVLSNKIQNQNVSAYMTQIAEFVSDCNKTVHSIVQRFEANYFDFLKKTVSNEWLRVPKQIFLLQDGEDANADYILSSTQVKQFSSWLEIDKVEELLAVEENVAHRLSQVPLPSVSAVDVTFPSVTPHLTSDLPDFGNIPQVFTMSVVKPDPSPHNESFPGDNNAGFPGKVNNPGQPRFPRSIDEPEIGFGFSGYLNRNLDHMMHSKSLERDRREGTSTGDLDSNNGNSPDVDLKDQRDKKENLNIREEQLIYDTAYQKKEKEKNAKADELPGARGASFNEEGTVDPKDLDILLADDPSSQSRKYSPSSGPSYPAMPQTSSSIKKTEEEGVNNTYLYVLIGVFLLLDIVLFSYRLSWLCNQLYAAKHGYADRIPTDDTCKQVLEIQTAYHLPAFDNSMENSVGYYVDAKDTLYVMQPEREGEITFLQSFPKTKDDILQKIFNEKMLNQDEERRLRSVRRCFFWRWCANLRAIVQRLFLSQLVWQTTVTLLAIIFVCVFIYCIEFWLTAENFRTLIGGQSATSDVQWELDTSGRYLHTLAYQLTTELGRMRVLCDMEVNSLTDAFFSTLNMQTAAFTTSLQRLCQESQEINCDKYTAFKPAGGRIVGCNFLPLQAHTFHDMNLSSIESLVSGEVMPFLTVSRRVMATSSVVIVLMLCFRLLCQAGATTVRHYFLLTGRLPRVKVYQSEEQCHPLKHGVGPNSTTAMLRSQSWVDSCESGVYVGEGEEATANKEEVPKLV